MPCFLRDCLRPPAVSFLSFDQYYLREAITLTSQHDNCPGQEAATFPVIGSNVVAAVVATLEHRTRKTAALQQILKLVSLSSCLSTTTPGTQSLQNLACEVKSKPPWLDNSLRGSRNPTYPSLGELSIKLLLPGSLPFYHEEDLRQYSSSLCPFLPPSCELVRLSMVTSAYFRVASCHLNQSL